jgi:hypothetical protein
MDDALVRWRRRARPVGPTRAAQVRTSDSTAARDAQECDIPGMPQRGVMVMQMTLP